MNIIIMDKLLRIPDPYDFDLAGSTPDSSNVRMPGNDIYIYIYIYKRAKSGANRFIS